MIARREQWRNELTIVRRLHTLVLEAEHILAADPLYDAGLPITNATVAQCFDDWCARVASQLQETTLPASERRCLEHFLHVTTNLRPHLIQCYDVSLLPRTNNDMEGFIRSIKSRYRRISGRKNWNRYLLRYGRRVAFYEARVRLGTLAQLDGAIPLVSHATWRVARAEQLERQAEQLKQFRIRHHRTQFLAALEHRWASAAPCTGLLP